MRKALAVRLEVVRLQHPLLIRGWRCCHEQESDAGMHDVDAGDGGSEDPDGGEHGHAVRVFVDLTMDLREGFGGDCVGSEEDARDGEGGACVIDILLHALD